MKKSTIKKFSAFILLIGGMFTVSVAEAQQHQCPCDPNRFGDYCIVDSHGNTRCKKFPNHCGGCTRIEPGNETETSLKQVNPNPVSGSTTISFSLEQSKKASFKIFDVSGKLVSTLADKIFEAGKNEIVWNAAEVNAGIYFLQFQSAETLQTEKLIVTK